MPVHMEALHISFEQYSLIWPVNGLLIVIGQPIINRVGLHFNMIRQIAVGVLIFAASFIMLIWAKNYLWFVIIMVVLTFGEMNGLPASRRGLIVWLMPRQRGGIRPCLIFLCHLVGQSVPYLVD